MDSSLLIVGLSGQIGDALLARGLPMPATALSRQLGSRARAQVPGLTWAEGDLASWRAPAADVLLSLGPLDALAAAVDEGRLRAGRIVAFGSTSVHAKAHSPDAAERALAARLAAAERRLAVAARRQGAALFLLRPTLVWGGGRDRTVSRIVALARQFSLLPLPLSAPGLRQPVRVDDLADAALAALVLPASAAGAYDLPGGERLAFGLMLRRSVAAGAPGCRPLPLPWRLLRAAAPLSPRWAGPLDRLGADLIFSAAPAEAQFGWAPRGFQPVAADFPPNA